MAGSPSKSKSKSKAAAPTAPVSVVDAKNVESVTSTTTTTTVITAVEETVATLEVNGQSAATADVVAAEVAPTTEVSNGRELPIFKNQLIANGTVASPVTHKPKGGRVKTTTGKGTVQVLKITAPTAEGEVVVMRRMDSDLVNATAMYNAAHPSVSESMQTQESDYVSTKFETEGAVVEKAGSGALAGVWVTVSQAKELAKEYGIDLFMQPLLEAPARKGTTKTAAATASATGSATISTSETTQEQEDQEQTSISETVVVTTTEEVIVKEETSTNEEETAQEVDQVEEPVKEEEKNEEEDEEPVVEEVATMKRRIDELEDQATRERKRFRGLITVAVGIAAVAALPQVLPYFS